MSKTIILIGPPGSGKTTAIETLEGGTVLFNFDPGGWRSLDRSPLPEEERSLILQGKKKARIPKRLKFAKTFRQWVETKDILQPDEILIIDYETKRNVINLGLMPLYSTDIFLESSQDINKMESQSLLKERGICHVVGDSLTGWQQAIHDAIITFRGPTKGGYIGPDQDTYGKAIEKMAEVIDTCYHLSVDFILTAHSRMDKDAISGKIVEELSIYGKSLPERIASMTDDIYYCSVDVSKNPPSYLWSAHPQDFLKALRARSFDYLPHTFEANFTKLYGERLVRPTPSTVPK